MLKVTKILKSSITFLKNNLWLMALLIYPFSQTLLKLQPVSQEEGLQKDGKFPRWSIFWKVTI